MKLVEINKDDEIVRIWIEVCENKIWYHYKGSTKVVEIVQKTKKSQKRTSHSLSGEIKAPMPGKVTKVCLSVEEKVKAGDSVVIMEAMKMEYNLKSEISGTVKKVCAKAGDHVDMDYLLVLIE